MSEVPSARSGDDETSLCALAAALTTMAHNLVEALPGVAQEEIRRKVVASLEGIRTVCSSLRSIDLLYDPEHARHFVRHAQGLSRLVLTMEETVAELTQTTDRVVESLDQHVRELESIAELPPDGDVSGPLQATVGRLREMAADMYENFNAITSKVSRATEAISTLESEFQEAREKAFIDALTRVHSRTAFDERLQAAIREGEATGPWCFLLIDVDHFQHVSELHGQIIGDALLFKVARVIEDAIPGEEDRCFLARYGGEQFALILAPADLAEASGVAEEVRGSVFAARWAHRGKPGRGIVQATVSIGLTQYRSGDTTASLSGRAHRALREAQAAGRNRTMVAKEAGE